MTLIMNPVINPNSNNLYYKRIIWAGITDANIDLNSIIQIADLSNKKNKNITQLQKDIKDVNLYPCLITWETTGGDKRFIEVDSQNSIDRRSKKIDKRSLWRDKKEYL